MLFNAFMEEWQGSAGFVRDSLSPSQTSMPAPLNGPYSPCFFAMIVTSSPHCRHTIRSVTFAHVA